MVEYYIVSDELYAQLAQPEREEQYYDWQVTSGKDEDVVAAGEEISEQLLGSFVAVDYIVYTVHEVYAPIMFVGLFIGIVFFVSAGSFLYFRLYTDLEEDKSKFNAISKIRSEEHTSELQSRGH